MNKKPFATKIFLPLPTGKPCSAAGFSLIEVLVAMFVFSIGLLGLAMLQLNGMRFNTDAYFRTQATLLAYDIIDRMRANPNGASSGYYTVASSGAAAAIQSSYGACKNGSCMCTSATCDKSTLALYDLGKWYESQQQLLPTSTTPTTIEKNGNLYTITMRWMERDLLMTQAWVVEL
jgi:type IV pilus assembly protein PilV